jgi:hypothetical protein
LARRGFAVSSLMLGLLLAEKRVLAGVEPDLVRATTSAATYFESGLPGCSSGLAAAPPADLLARAESAAAAIANPRRVSLGRLFFAASAVVAVSLLAEPVSHAWFGGRSVPRPLPRGSIAALRWGRSSTGFIAQPVARMSVGSYNVPVPASGIR